MANTCEQLEPVVLRLFGMISARLCQRRRRTDLRQQSFGERRIRHAVGDQHFQQKCLSDSQSAGIIRAKDLFECCGMHCPDLLWPDAGRDQLFGQEDGLPCKVAFSTTVAHLFEDTRVDPWCGCCGFGHILPLREILKCTI